MCYVLSLYMSMIQNILFILLTEITMSVHVSVIQITEHFIHPAHGNYTVSSGVWRLQCQFICDTEYFHSILFMEITVHVYGNYSQFMCL